MYHKYDQLYTCVHSIGFVSTFQHFNLISKNNISI